jgi:hypothetical protein
LATLRDRESRKELASQAGPSLPPPGLPHTLWWRGGVAPSGGTEGTLVL